MIRVISGRPAPPVTIEVVTDPEEVAKARRQHEQFNRNARWLQEHAHEVYAQNRGRYFCIAGQELFVADTAEAAITAARAKHPDDQGYFFRYIPAEKRARL
jgi:hypothetical protein